MIASKAMDQNEWGASACPVNPGSGISPERGNEDLLHTIGHPSILVNTAHARRAQLSAVTDSIEAGEGGFIVTDALRTSTPPAAPLWAEQLAVFDTETTGIDTSQARVVSATIALLNASGEVLERYDWLLDPGVEIPDAAYRVHGISTAIARSSGVQAEVGITQIIEQLQAMIERGYPLVAYNAPFDLTLLKSEALRYGTAFPETIRPVIDPLILDKQFDRYRRGKRTLEVVAPHYGVTIGNAHDAGDDAIASGRVLQAIGRKYADLLPQDAIPLHDAQVAWAAAQAENFQEYMRRVRDPAFVADGRWPIR